MLLMFPAIWSILIVSKEEIDIYLILLFIYGSFIMRSAGCIVNDIITIHVQGVDVPNVFTPNGDGTNDFFVVDNHGMETLNMLIFNRWGEKVFEWNTTQTAWDGTGLDMEEGRAGGYDLEVEVGKAGSTGVEMEKGRGES